MTTQPTAATTSKATYTHQSPVIWYYGCSHPYTGEDASENLIWAVVHATPAFVWAYRVGTRDCAPEVQRRARSYFEAGTTRISQEQGGAMLDARAARVKQYRAARTQLVTAYNALTTAYHAVGRLECPDANSVARLQAQAQALEAALASFSG